MRPTAWMAVWLGAVLAACSPAPPEQQVIDRAARALGGVDRVRAVRTLVLEGEGVQYNLGQDVVPGAAGQTFTVREYRRAIDLEAGRARTGFTRTPNFLFFQGQAPQRIVQGVDGEVGYNVAPSGAATRVAVAAAHDRRAEIYHHPVALVRAALAPGGRAANVRDEGARRLVDVTTPDGLAFTMAVDPATGTPLRIAHRTAHPNLGDVVVATEFAEYVSVDGLRLPSLFTTRTDDFVTLELHVSAQRVDADAGDLRAPAAAASAAPPAPPAPDVAVEQVGPGLWLLAGQSHHSALAEFADHLVLIEAPQSEARTLAVIAAARALRPEKPLTRVVATHHHFDHTAGIRAAIAEGLTVVTHAGNRAFFEDVARRPHTIVPDALATRPRALAIETVDDERLFEDKAMSMALYHVAGNPHSETMLMAYFPRHRVVVQVDAFSPAAQVHPYAANLLENIRKRHLRVDRIVPLHGSIVPFAALEKAAAAAVPGTS